MTGMSQFLAHPVLLLLLTPAVAPFAEAQTPPQLPPDPTFAIERVSPAQRQPADGRIVFEVFWTAQHAPEITLETIRVTLDLALSDGSKQTVSETVPGSSRSIRLTVPRPPGAALFNAATVKLAAALRYSVPGFTAGSRTVAF